MRAQPWWWAGAWGNGVMGPWGPEHHGGMEGMLRGMEASCHEGSHSAMVGWVGGGAGRSVPWSHGLMPLDPLS